ncbi:MAG: TrkA family potassium uptake protein [bacterium]
MFVVVVGCGQTGSALADALSQAGHSVVALDSDQSKLDALPPEFTGFTVRGDAGDLAVLRQCRMEQADAAVVVTRDDNLNLMVAQVCRTAFDVRLVLARCYDPAREGVYRELGVEALSPSRLMVAALRDRLARPGQEQ